MERWVGSHYEGSGMPGFGLVEGHVLFTLFLAHYFATALKTSHTNLQLTAASSSSTSGASASWSCPQHCPHLQVTPGLTGAAWAGWAGPMPDTCLTAGELGFCGLGWQVPQGSCLLLLQEPGGQKWRISSVLREHGVRPLPICAGGRAGRLWPCLECP